MNPKVSGTTMQAVWYERNGAARDVLTFGELPVPDVGPGEVRVRLHSSSVNPIDIKRRQGVLAMYDAPMPFPRIIPHDDGAGVIDAVGPGIDRACEGQRVWVYLAQARRPAGPPELRDGRPFGTAAEFVVVPSRLAVPLPERVGFKQASVIGIPAITAHRCIYADGPVDRKTVLVAGGAGSVGQYAIQFAKEGGARVITTVSGAEKMALVRSLGADDIVDYKDEDAAARILDFTGSKGVDLVCETDFAANLELNGKVLRPQGTINTFGSDSNQTPQLTIRTLNLKELVVRFIFYYTFPDAAFDEAIRAITRMLKLGTLRHPVASCYPLANVVAAHEAVEAGGVIGKSIIEIIK